MRINSSDFHREFFDPSDRPKVKLPSGTEVYVKFVEINANVIRLNMSYQDKKILAILIAREIEKRLGSHSLLQVNDKYLGYFDLLLTNPELDLTIDYVVLEEEYYYYLNIISVG